MSFRANCQVPTACSNPASVGATAGGGFAINNNQSSYCLPLSGTGTLDVVNFPINGQSPTALISYLFDYKDGQSILGTLPTATSKPVTIADADRDYYVLQVLQSGANQLIICHKIIIVSTSVIKVDVNDCGSNVKLTLPADAANKYTNYSINWGDGSPGQTLTGTLPQNISHTYTGTQSRNITVVGSIGACNSVPFTYTHNPTSNLYISRLEMTDNGMGAKMTFANSTPTDTYTIMADKNNSGNWITVGSGTNGAGIIAAAPGLDSTATYCFRIEGKDACGNLTQSPATCSISLKTQAISTSQVNLTWNQPTGASSTGFSIARNQTGISTVTKKPTPITDNKYTDTGLTCSLPYTYQITGTYDIPNVGPVVTISTAKSVSTNIPTMLPALDPFGIASVEHNSMIKFIIADYTQKTKYRFERSVDDDNTFKVVQETDGKNPGANEYDDKNVDPLNHRYCYRISYSDDCGNWSAPSAPLCSVLLTSDGPASLTWTPFIDDPNYKANVVYDLFEVDTTSGLPKGNPILYHVHETSGIVNILDDTDSKSYIIVATYIPNGLTTGGIGSSSNTVIFQIPAKLFIPTAFTPNGDGTNENFITVGKHIAEFNMIIYDRWGKPIYESNSIKEGWDGNMADRTTTAPAGIYGYVVFITDTHGQKFTRTGSVTLIR